MQLKYLSIAELIAGAGGDPWEINRTLQAGQPGQISGLANAFHAAGRHTAEADAAFDQARKRFDAAWNHQNGNSPINDADEVQRTAKALGAQSEQLPKIGADLEKIAADLADAQKSGAAEIAALEHKLEVLDRIIGAATEDLKHTDLTPDDRHALEALIRAAKADAVDDTRDALDRLRATRDNYTKSLHQAQKSLADDGYDPERVLGFDGHAPETPEQARQDVTDALAGDKGAAARVNGVLHSVSPEQVAGKTPLTSEQAAVLSQLQAQEHGMSMDALTAAEQRLGDEKGMIGDSLQLMSNPNITFPKTDTKVGAVQGGDTLRGGAAQLPESVQQLLNAHWPDLRHLNQLAGIVKDGNRSLQANTDLDKGMMKQASALMNGAFWRAGEGQAGDLKPNIDPTVSNVLSAVSPDHQVVHDAMTGADHDRFLQNLTHHYWQDHGDAVSSLFSWTGDAARGPEARLAGETAHAYSSYIGNHPELMHLPGNHTLGEMDPKLVQGMAHGLGPYVNNIAGTSGGLPEFGYPLDDEGNTRSGALPVAKEIFTVIDSDKDAATYFNGQAYAQAVVHEAAFGNETTHSGYDAQLYDAATLKGLVDVGTHNAHLANETNGFHQQQSEYEIKKQAYEAGLTGLTTAAGLPPGVGTAASPALNVLGHGLENSILGPPPTGPNENPIQPLDIGYADQGMANALLGAGHNVPLPPEYVIHDADHPNGRLATLDEVKARIPGVTAGQYDSVIGPAVSQAIGLPPAEKMAPDEWMATRYDNVVGVPHPNQGTP
ncbi:hypothetical protein A5714_13560 [Mycobacterium sp. E2462]|uniref:putative alpha/beta hydrolase n=1 Tax=Mycobacterium sp. E2462 TaxID=1834133 RepID=UPI000800E733|nr:hypothetical protein [Mycobacterium sp. E2462]OBI14530.1 hypothetical protein A5714_13560 [Mycobacterium sp. E2462]